MAEFADRQNGHVNSRSTSHEGDTSVYTSNLRTHPYIKGRNDGQTDALPIHPNAKLRPRQLRHHSAAQAAMHARKARAASQASAQDTFQAPKTYPEQEDKAKVAEVAKPQVEATPPALLPPAPPIAVAASPVVAPVAAPPTTKAKVTKNTDALEAEADSFMQEGDPEMESAAPTGDDGKPQPLVNGAGWPKTNLGDRKPSQRPGTGNEDGAQRQALLQKSRPTIETASEGAMLRSITDNRGLNMVQAMALSKEKYGKAKMETHRSTWESLPVIDQPTGMPAKPVVPKQFGNEKPVPGKKAEIKKGPAFMPRNYVMEHQVPETKSFWNRFMDHARSTAPDPQTETAEQLQNLVHSNETPNVDTSFGEVPQVPLTGGSDPALAQENRDAAHAQTAVEMQQYHQAAGQDFGEALIFPDIEVGTMQPNGEFGAGVDYTYQNPPLHDVKAEHWDLLSDDAELKLRGEADRCSAESLQVESDFETERSRHIDEGRSSIAAEEAATTEAQLTAKADNAAGIADLRTDWQLENEGVLEEFDTAASTEHDEMTTEFDALMGETEGDVNECVEQAQFDAEEAKCRAEEKVAERREEAKKKEQEKSWFDQAIDAVKSFFEELINFVKKTFDDLRTWVKQKFEQAKKWVAERIEQARQAIVKTIQWFGEKLKGFVDIAFALFPKIRDKFKAKIDQAMDATIDFVNKAAEKLKAFTQKVLDMMAAAVDLALQVMEIATVALLKTMEIMVETAIRVVEAFYEILLNQILMIATLVAFVALIAGGFLLGVMWDFLGKEAKAFLIELLFDTAIWVFENAPDDMRFGIIWPMFVHMMLGFLYQADASPTDEKIAIMDKIADILTLQDTDFVWNFVLNIFVGIWDNIKGIFEGIWALIRFICYDAWVMLGNLIDWIKKVAPDVEAAITGLVGDIKTFVADFKKEGPDKVASIISAKNIQKVLEFLNGLGDSLRVQAQVMGAKMAFNFGELMKSGKGGAVIGEKLGWLYGNIIVEVVLAVCTFGIGAAVKGGLKAAEWLGRVASWFAKFGKIGRAMGKVANLLGKGLKWLMTTVQKFAERLMELGNKLLDKFKQIFKNLEKKIDDIVAKLSGKGDDVAEHADDGPHAHNGPDGKVKVDEDGVVDTKNVDPEDAKRRKATGDRDADYLYAVAEAKALIALHDKVDDEPHLAATTVLGLLRPKYSWINGLRVEMNGRSMFDFLLKASPEQNIYRNYTISSLAAQVQAKLNLYPNVIDPRTGRQIPLPHVDGIVEKAARVEWTKNDRASFIKSWYDNGFSTPAGGWDKYDIHHIKPREFGGTNEFWNLVPVERSVHQSLFNDFWRQFGNL